MITYLTMDYRKMQKSGGFVKNIFIQQTRTTYVEL